MCSTIVVRLNIISQINPNQSDFLGHTKCPLSKNKSNDHVFLAVEPIIMFSSCKLLASTSPMPTHVGLAVFLEMSSSGNHQGHSGTPFSGNVSSFCNVNRSVNKTLTSTKTPKTIVSCCESKRKTLGMTPFSHLDLPTTRKTSWNGRGEERMG